MIGFLAVLSGIGVDSDWLDLDFYFLRVVASPHNYPWNGSHHGGHGQPV